MRLNKRFWLIYALLMACGIWYAVYAITKQEEIILPYNNPEDIATYNRIDTMKNLSAHQKLVYKQKSVTIRKKFEKWTRIWARQLNLEFKFHQTAENIVSLATKNMPDEIIKCDLNKPAVYSNTFSADIAEFSRRVGSLSSDPKSLVYKTIMIDSNKILYKYYYCRHQDGIDKPAGQINMLFDVCISTSMCTNIKIFDKLEMDQVYIKPRSLEDDLNN
ncbi:hypothetical protein ACFGVR_02390 [Mucilaginibacter sp. AW1-3]